MSTEVPDERRDRSQALLYVEPWPSGGWAVKLSGHAIPISRHDTEDEARAKAASYGRGFEEERHRGGQALGRASPDI
jgi:hypothetical protein